MADKLFTHGVATVGELMASTTALYLEKTPIDQIFNKRPFLNKMLSKAQTKDGGSSILTSVMYESNSTAQNYDRYDILDVTPQDGLTDTQAQWKQASVSVTIDGKYAALNSGSSKVFDLLDTKRKQAMEALEEKLNGNLFAAVVGSKAVESLATMILASGTIQDINSSTSSWWQSTVTSGGSFATQGLSDLRTTYSTVDQMAGSTSPDILVTTDTIFNYYEGALTPNTRYTDGQTPTGSFAGLKFKNATMFYDKAATSGVIYMFSSDDLYLVIQSGSSFRVTEFVKPANQDAKTGQILFMGQLVTKARRRLAKITGITA